MKRNVIILIISVWNFWATPFSKLVITEYLFGHFRAEAEGQLTKLRSRLVSREALRAHAAALDLGRYILMGRGEESSGGRGRTSTLADAFEALIGAIYLDGGLEAAKEFHFDANSQQSRTTGGNTSGHQSQGPASGVVAKHLAAQSGL